MPYFVIPVLSLWDGKLTLTVFGLLVGVAVVVGSIFTLRRARVLGLPEERVHSMIFFTVLFGLIASHVLDVVFYQEGPWDMARLKQLLDPRQGLSSMGGFLGAVVALVIWCKANKQRILPYADSLGYGLAFGWVFGRLGCYTAHDHPGTTSPFPLAVAWPCDPRDPLLKTGFHMVTHASKDIAVCARHDLGLYEALLALAIALLFVVIARVVRPRTGFFVALLTTLYGPIRFCLDFLRAPATQGGDVRLWGGPLTPAQYAAVAITLAGLILWVRVFQQPSVSTAIPSTGPAPSTSKRKRM